MDNNIRTNAILSFHMRNFKLLAILLVAVIIRLYHIDYPVGGSHAWRQADTAAMAANFYNNGFNLLFPEVDWNGGGVVESEFPIFPFLASILYSIFYPSDIWGRILAIIFSLFTITGIYFLVKKILDNRTALIASLIYAVLPMNVYYTRIFMPESMMLCCTIWGVYFFYLYIFENNKHAFLLSAVFISLTILLKITILFIGLPLLAIAWLKYNHKFILQWKLWAYALIILIPPAFWYYHAHQLYLESGISFGIWFAGSDKWGIFEPLLTLKWYNDIFFKSIAERHLTYAGFILFLPGLFIKRKNAKEYIFDFWLVGLLIFFIIVAVGNQVHDYYQLPFTIPAVIYIAKVINKTQFQLKDNKLLLYSVRIILIILTVLSFLRVANFMRGESKIAPVYSLANSVQKFTPEGSKVIAVDFGDPFLLYISKKKGWHASPNDLSEVFIKEKVNLGAEYLISEKNLFFEQNSHDKFKFLINNYEIVYQTDDYFIIRLN